MAKILIVTSQCNNFMLPSSILGWSANIGKVPEWPNGADCKSAGYYLRWFESISSHVIPIYSLVLSKADVGR